MEQEVRRGPGRPPKDRGDASDAGVEAVVAARSSRFLTRAEQTMAERRARYGGQLNMGAVLRLEMPDDMYAPGAALDRERYVTRWISDEGNRLHEMTNRGGYDFVSSDGEAGLLSVDTARQDGTLVRQPVGTTEHGAPVYGYLCRKPREWAEDEDRETVGRTQAQMQGILRGEKTAVGQSGEIGVEQGYVPNGVQNTIGRERGRIARPAETEYRP